MKIPEQIRINGVFHAVTNADALNDGIQMLYGNVTWEDSKIRLKSDQGHQHKCITLWHEIVHALIHHACLNVDDDIEEKIAEALGYGIYQVLQDNGGRMFDLRKEDIKFEHIGSLCEK